MLDLSQLSKYKENNRIEAKKAQGGLPRSIWETYSAFANTFGGYILLGVVENADKSFSSVPLSSPEKIVSDFWNSVNNHSVVKIIFFLTEMCRLSKAAETELLLLRFLVPTVTTSLFMLDRTLLLVLTVAMARVIIAAQKTKCVR